MLVLLLLSFSRLPDQTLLNMVCQSYKGVLVPPKGARIRDLCLRRQQKIGLDGVGVLDGIPVTVIFLVKQHGQQ